MRRSPGGVETRRQRLAGFLVRSVLVAVGAELVELNAVRIVAPVLLSDVVAVLAIGACERDLGADVGRLGHDASFWSASGTRPEVAAVGLSHRLAERTARLVTARLGVAEAGLEPATQRL